MKILKIPAKKTWHFEYDQKGLMSDILSEKLSILLWRDSAFTLSLLRDRILRDRI